MCKNVKRCFYIENFASDFFHPCGKPKGKYCKNIIKHYCETLLDLERVEFEAFFQECAQYLNPYMTILSIGCGCSPELDVLRGYDFYRLAYTGVDRSEEWKQYRNDSEGDVYLTCQISKCDLDYSTFNTIYFGYSLSHILRFRSADNDVEINEIKKIISQIPIGSQVIFADICQAEVQEEIKSLMRDAGLEQVIVRYFKDRSMSYDSESGNQLLGRGVYRLFRKVR